jgi:hypothetical protein
MPGLGVLLTDAAELATDASRAGQHHGPVVDETDLVLTAQKQKLEMEKKRIDLQIKAVEDVHTAVLGAPVKDAARRAVTWHLPKA